jgi:hypothetical protein
VGKSDGVVGRKQKETRQVHVQEGQIEAALDQVNEGKEERDEKNDCQKTHLPNCLNYPLSFSRNAQVVFRIHFRGLKPVLIRPTRERAQGYAPELVLVGYTGGGQNRRKHQPSTPG